MTDWTKILKDLRYCGLSAKGIERLSAGLVKARVVHELTSGHLAQPKHEQGKFLEKLHGDMQKILRERTNSSATEVAT